MTYCCFSEAASVYFFSNFHTSSSLKIVTGLYSYIIFLFDYRNTFEFTEKIKRLHWRKKRLKVFD